MKEFRDEGQNLRCVLSSSDVFVYLLLFFITWTKWRSTSFCNDSMYSKTHFLL